MGVTVNSTPYLKLKCSFRDNEYIQESKITYLNFLTMIFQYILQFYNIVKESQAVIIQIFLHV